MKTLLLLLLASFTFAMDMDALVSHLKFEEGYSSTRYLDTRGYWTIGYGHRCSSKQKPITQEEAERLLAADIDKAMKAVGRMVDSDTPEQVRFILISMTFQMGEGGVRGFENMLKNINRGNYKAAAVNMKRSDWKKQTPERCLRLANIMASVK
jgi:GH24 family phage-related lysozyme (muramidase)